MSSLDKKINEIYIKYRKTNNDYYQEVMDHLKNKFPEQYKKKLEDLKNDGSDDPELEMNINSF